MTSLQRTTLGRWLRRYLLRRALWAQMEAYLALHEWRRASNVCNRLRRLDRL